MSRPQSAQSRGAWQVEGADNRGMDSSSNFGQGQGELYDSSAHIDNMPQDVQVREQEGGCWHGFKKGVRSLWATRQTENVDDNPELHVKTTLRELVVYIIFLVILCVVTFGMTSSTMYYYTKVMSDLFLDSSYPDTKNTFRGSNTMMDFWRFAENPMVDGLYWDKWYNNDNVTEPGYIYYENKLLGVPRLRQLKVRDDSCIVHDDFKDEITACYDSYAVSIEDTQPFGLADNTTAWTYTPEEDLESGSHWGYITTYGGGGYYKDLGRNRSATVDIIAELKQNLWLDRGSRAIFLDFTVYNANINLFCVIRLLMEFPATGGAIPSWTFRTVKLLRYVTVTDYFVMACECIFAIFIFYYMVEESIEIKRNKFAYFCSFWNILDVLVIGISIICITFNVYRTMAVSKMLDTLLDDPDAFPDFEFLSFWQDVFNSAIAITVFMAWVKVFKYISFNKTMTQLSSTLARCAKDLAGFAVMFFIIFLAFAQLGYLIFGTQVYDFSSFNNSIFTLFRIILGDFDFHSLEEANRILGPLYFILYVFFVFFVLLNMFLAIINDTYSEVKEDLAGQKNEFEMGDYFKKGYSNMLNKLNLKRDKIVDIQKALAAADINQDKQLDFDEWRQDLKTRGYAEAEIEAVFAKYDLDGDRVLDEEEMVKMQNDLEGQKDNLNKEIDQHDGSGGEGSDDESGSGTNRGGGRPIVNGVSYEEFTVLSRRVDRMEHSIGSIVSKIDAVLVKLEAMERAKSRRRETMSKILDNITEGDSNDEAKRDQMERLVRDELERWDSESNMGGGSSSGGGPRSRPASAARNTQGQSEA